MHDDCDDDDCDDDDCDDCDDDDADDDTVCDEIKQHVHFMVLQRFVAKTTQTMFIIKNVLIP